MTISALLALIQEQAPAGATPAGADPGLASGTAAGQDPAVGPGFSWISILPWVAIFAIFYVVMIMPERKARKKRETMLAAVKKGDRVMTSSGMFATVAAIEGDEITLQIADGVRARFTRQAITQVVEASGNDAKK